MISYLERISPERKRSELKTIREFKNTIKSHGVNPGLKEPIVPEEWIQWLLNELEWCKRNYKIIAPKLQKELDKGQAGRKPTQSKQTPHATSEPSYQTYYREMYGYNRPSSSGSSKKRAFEFVSAPPRIGLFGRIPDGYAWVICNHSGDFLMETAYVHWSSSFERAVVFKTEKEAKKLVDSFLRDSTSWGGNKPFFRIRCIKIL
jgi:hypothetical protein